MNDVYEPPRAALHEALPRAHRGRNAFVGFAAAFVAVVLLAIVFESRRAMPWSSMNWGNFAIGILLPSALGGLFGAALHRTRAIWIALVAPCLALFALFAGLLIIASALDRFA